MYLVWLRVAAVLYAVASLTALPAVLYAFPRWRKICLPAAGLAVLFHLVSAVEMLEVAHHWVPVSYGEIESILGLLIAAIFLAIGGIYGTVSFGIFALPASFLLVFVPALGEARYQFPSEGVKVGWLVVHIAFLLAAYACLAFSMVASFLYLVQERRLKSHVVGFSYIPPTSNPPQGLRPVLGGPGRRDVGHPGTRPGERSGSFAALEDDNSVSKLSSFPTSNPPQGLRPVLGGPGRRDVGHPLPVSGQIGSSGGGAARLMMSWDLLPPLDTLERIAHATLLFGFPCMTLGLLVGSLLAQESVGAAYFFDPKVLLSFAMWALYVVLLYIRRSAGLRGRRAAYLSSAVFVVMLLVFAANQFSQVHRYPAP